MLHILLVILKIIGILLLIVLGMILLTVLAVLFVPLRYTAHVSRKEEEGEPPVRVLVKASWLLHLLNVRASYDGKFLLRIRIAVFQIFGIPQPQKRQKKSKAHRKPKKSGTQQKEQLPAQEEVPVEETQNEEDTKENPVEPDKTAEESRNAAETNVKKEENPEKEKHGSAKSPKPKRRKKDVLANIRYTISGFCDKIKRILGNIEYYRELLKSDSFQEAFALCKGQLLYLFRKIKPKKIAAEWIIGTEDPLLTGEILAVYGILYPLLGPKVRIVGDFDNKRLEGELFLKGKLRVVTFVKIFIKVYFDKNLKRLIQLCKKEAV